MTEKSVFLDTSFLIASQISGHEFFERTKYLRKKFLFGEYGQFTSSIVFDELWYVLIGILRNQPKSTTNSIYKLVRKATQNVLSIEGLQLKDLDLDKNELLDVVEIMHKFSLRPRDAILVKIMKKAKIKHIASFDKDFDKITGVTRIY